MVHVRDRGLLAGTDAQVLEKAFDEDRIAVTSNVDDFVAMVQSVEVHGGVVLVEDGSLHREEQNQVVQDAISLLLAEYEAGRNLVKRVLGSTSRDVHLGNSTF